MKVFFSTNILAATIFLCFSVAAQEANFLGEFEEWEAFKEFNGGKPVCYMGTKPIKAIGKYKKRGDNYVLVTHRPAEKSFGVVSVRAGYKFKKASEAIVSIGIHNFNLFTDGGHAFAFENKDDFALIMAMKKGTNMIIKGTSSRGTKTTDTYSLKGVTAAWKAINKACKKN